MQAAEAAPYNAKLASMPIISDAKGVDLADLDEPAAITASIDAQDRADTDSLPDASLEEDVPMADYSGHEDMWAAAMAIMAEAAEPAPVAVPAPAASPVSLLPSMSPPQFRASRGYRAYLARGYRARRGYRCRRYGKPSS